MAVDLYLGVITMGDEIKAPVAIDNTETIRR
jgi:hypothetical protein